MISPFSEFGGACIHYNFTAKQPEDHNSVDAGISSGDDDMDTGLRWLNLVIVMLLEMCENVKLCACIPVLWFIICLNTCCETIIFLIIFFLIPK